MSAQVDVDRFLSSSVEKGCDSTLQRAYGAVARTKGSLGVEEAPGPAAAAVLHRRRGAFAVGLAAFISTLENGILCVLF